MRNFILFFLLVSVSYIDIKAQIKVYHLQNLNLEAGDDFGSSVSINEEWIAVGARRFRNETGQVLIYKSSANAWLLKQELVASEVVEGDFFGSDLAMTDKYLVAGAPTDHWVSGLEGKVVVYELINGAWAEQSTLYPPSNFQASAYGYIVNSHKEKIVVGAPDQNWEGAVVVYGNEGGEWIELQVISPESNNQRNFGGAIDMNDEWLVIGAYNSIPDEGTALEILLYKWENGQYVNKQSIINERVAIPFQIPYWNMELSDNQLIVGNHRVNNGENITGGTKVYSLNGSTWVLDQTLSPSGFELHELGRHVALSERFAMFGASNFPSSDFDEPHHVIFYETSNPDSWNPIGTFSYEGSSFLDWQAFNFDIGERFATAGTGNSLNQHGDVYIYDLRSFITTSVNQLPLENIKLFPTITNSSITIQADKVLKNISIYNSSGNEVMNKLVNLNTLELSLSLSRLIQGTYFVLVETETGNLFKKIIKL